MKIKMLGNLGKDWPEPWKNGQVVDADDETANKLIAKNLAEQVHDEPKPEQAPLKSEVKDPSKEASIHQELKPEPVKTEPVKVEPVKPTPHIRSHK